MAKVGIVMGSDSDMPIMAKAADVLEELGIDYEMTIISAHREPDVFFEYAKTAEEKGFKVEDKFKLDDSFFVLENLDLENMTTREILANAVIVRIVERDGGRLVKNITYKKKVFDDEGNILSQSKVECDVLNEEDAKRLFSAIGYKEIMRIKESDIAFEKDGFSFAVKDIENGAKLIEAEADLKIEEMNSLEKIKAMFDKYEIPIYKDDYFIKKAELELNKILKRD